MRRLLDPLRIRRTKQREGYDYPHPFSIESVKHPLQLIIPKPLKAPVFYDKMKLLELGLKDVETEVALILWEQRRPMFVRNRYRDTDLLREMDVSRTTIQGAISRLEKLGIVERTDDDSGSVRALEPVRIAGAVKEVLTARISSILEFLEFRQREYENLY